MNAKTCKTCGKLKLYSEFHKNAHNRDGHQSTCVICYREKYRANKANNATDQIKDQGCPIINSVIRSKPFGHIRRAS